MATWLTVVSCFVKVMFLNVVFEVLPFWTNLNFCLNFYAKLHKKACWKKSKFQRITICSVYISFCFRVTWHSIVLPVDYDIINHVTCGSLLKKITLDYLMMEIVFPGLNNKRWTEKCYLFVFAWPSFLPWSPSPMGKEYNYSRHLFKFLN